MPVHEPGESVAAATEIALAAAEHLTDMDAGAVETLRKCASKIDAWDVIVQWAREDVEGKRGFEARPVVPEHDNTTIPTYLKLCESLGLTPAGRLKLPKPKETKQGGRLQSIQGGVANARGKRASAGA